MKKKYAAIAMSLFFAVASLYGCGSTNTDDAFGSSEDSTIYGEVTGVGEDTITITIGTLKERNENKDEERMPEKSPQNQENGESSPESSTQDGGGPGMGGVDLDLTEEEMEIKVSADTTIQKQGMGKPSDEDDEQGEIQTPPEKPAGEDGEQGDAQTLPEKPDEENSTQDGSLPEERPDAVEQEGEEITLDEMKEGDIVAVIMKDEETAKKVTLMSGFGGKGGNMNSAKGVESYDAENEYSSDSEISSETLTSTGKDENAVLVSEGATVFITDTSVTRKSSESTGRDNSSFYGVGAALLTTDGTSYINNSTIETDAAGGTGVFAYGDGTVYISDTTISTKQDTSGGIHAAGGGTLYAWNIIVETKGESSAAIRSDRGGGTIVVDEGNYISNGTGSPAIYSTADIAVNHAKLAANGSEAICIEGENSIHLYDSDLTGNMSEDEQNNCTWNVILYQSMSGDSEEGNSIFEMEGGSLTAKNGGMFYTTNTESTITLSDVDLTNAPDSEFLLRCSGNANKRGWGKTGENGAKCLFTAINQEMEGDVIWDSISELNYYLTAQSTWKGAILQDETYAGEGGSGFCNIYIEEGSTWTVTGDSVISTLQNSGTILDDTGKTVTIKGSDGTVYVTGEGDYTITVDAYETNADVSGASSVTVWEQYETERPVQLS